MLKDVVSAVRPCVCLTTKLASSRGSVGSLVSVRLDSRFVASALVTDTPFIRSHLGVSLETPDGYDAGALCVMDTVPHRYDPQQIDVLKNVVVVDEVELHSLVLTDQLTGAFSRRALASEVDKAVSRFARNGHVGALVTCDLDHIKCINDTQGHDAGEKVLRVVGHLCVGLMRRRIRLPAARHERWPPPWKPPTVTVTRYQIGKKTLQCPTRAPPMQCVGRALRDLGHVRVRPGSWL